MNETRPLTVGLVGGLLLAGTGCGAPQHDATAPPTSSPATATSSVATDQTTRTVAFICGDTPLAIQVHDEAIDLVLADATHRLAQVVVASGAKYEATVNGDTYSFWQHGEEATLTAGGRTYPACQQVDPAAAGTVR